MGDQPAEEKLNSPPTDAVSAVKFAPDTNQFVVASSWDCTVRLYDVVSNNLRLTFRHNAPVLDCVFQDSVHCFSGDLDNHLKQFDFNTSAETEFGSHDAPIRCVHYCAEIGTVITGSWDATVRLWDPRTGSLTSSHAQPDKVYTLDTCGDKLIVGTAMRKVFVWDLRNMGYPQQRRDSSLKYQTRCIRAFPNKQGFALSSIEGRVAIEYMDPSPDIQKKKYAFKCHRLKDDGVETIHPVNAIAFHPAHNTFATGGSDRFVNIWDGFNKKRLCQFHRYPTSISSLSFSHDGKLLAIASSYLFEEGDKPDIPENSIFIRNIAEQEVKPK